MSEQQDSNRFSLVRRELRVFRESFRLVFHLPRLIKAPTGTCTVMVLPGFTTSDRVMAPLRVYLRNRGHRVSGWGLGVNRGQVDLNLPRVIARVEALVAENRGGPITLIGWSLGGVFAREVARARPDLVTQVVTMATPAKSYSRRARDPEAPTISRQITAFFSKHDGVVHWTESQDDLNPDVEMIEVASSHLGITLDPTVWLATAERLSASSPSEEP